jgi:nucleoside-specific outer membrane channel protein Tsx
MRLVAVVALSGAVGLGAAVCTGSSGAAIVARAQTTPPIGKQLAELKGSDTSGDDWFGYSVAASGGTAIVGAPFHAKDAGRAYVFTKTAPGWEQTAELKGSDTVTGNEFGFSVGISGTTAIVGAWVHDKAAGRAYVFSKTATGWEQTAELKGSDTVTGDDFGGSVAISGNIAIVGAYGYATSVGRAYVFAKTVSGWKQVAELKGSDTVAGDYFGSSVAVSGTIAVVGAPGHAKAAGRAYVFTKTASGWKEVAELKGSDTVAYNRFGQRVAVSGKTAVVGAWLHDRAYVFTTAASGWKQIAELKGSDTVAGDDFGGSCAISGSTAIVGAYSHAKSAGRAYVFDT